MLRCILFTSVLLAVTMAFTIPWSNVCKDRCEAWKDLNRKCIKEKACWDLDNHRYTTRVKTCLSECQRLSTPCFDACRRTFKHCETKCSMQTSDCYYACYDEKFKEIVPELPTQDELIFSGDMESSAP